MKQLGIPPFGPRFKPRSPARAAEEQAIAERNKVRFDRSMRVGMDVAVLVASGRTVMAAAQELGIGVEACRQRLLKFIRLAGHPARFGEVMSPATDWRKIEPYLLNEAVRRMKIELESGARDVWSEPVSASFSEK
ncbi:MAG: hypothetical protein HY040_04755 [Planctomycetes bacterium]|nr:hypothetical protein [Planctomycetota bacterium]